MATTADLLAINPRTADASVLVRTFAHWDRGTAFALSDDEFAAKAAIRDELNRRGIDPAFFGLGKCRRHLFLGWCECRGGR